MTFPNFWIRGKAGLVAVAIAMAFASNATGAESGSKSAPSTPPTASKPAPEPADNSFCLVCHRNFEKEPLSVSHTKIGVGCEQCHGMSERHSADEDGITPPEKMYSKARINPSCVKCHTADKLDDNDAHRLALAMTKTHKPGESAPAAVQAGDKKTQAIWICTDCHGQHRMKVRTRVWDKDTGKLIKDDGVRMMDKNRPAK